MKYTSTWLAWFTLLLVTGAYASQSIDWNHWELAAFEAAKTKNKIILVNVGMEGCALEPDPRSPFATPPEPAETQLSRIRDDLRQRLSSLHSSIEPRMEYAPTR